MATQKILFLSLVIFLGFSGLASAIEAKVNHTTKEIFPGQETRLPRSWYVSTNGSDSDGDGSQNSPFGSIQHAMGLTVPWDTVLVECGTYYESNIDLQTGVTLRSESGEANCVTVDAQQQHFAMGCINENSIRVEGLTIINGYEYYAGAMWFGNTTNISVNNCSLNSCPHRYALHWIYSTLNLLPY